MKHMAKIEKQDGPQTPEERKTQLGAASKAPPPAYGVSIRIQRTEPIQLKAPHAAGASGKKAHIERDFGACTIGLDIPQFETGREEQTSRQGEIVPSLQHKFHKIEVRYQGSGGMVNSAAQDHPMGRIEETIAGIVLHLHKLHEQGVVFSNLLFNSTEGGPIHMAKIIVTKVQSCHAGERFGETMFNPRLGADAEQVEGRLGPA